MKSSSVPTRSVQFGGAAVEAAILMIPMLLFVFGIAEGGRALFTYNTIAKSTRDGTRYLSSLEPGTGREAAACLVVYGKPSCTDDDSPLVPGLATGNVTVCDAVNCPATHHLAPVDGNGGPATGVMNIVTVTVTGFRPELFIGVTMPSIEFGPISTTMRQAL
jgi:Flp pilus assembly protein TadG